MLRRFESYAFRDGTSPGQIAELTRALRRASEFIPEILFSVAAENQSVADAALVWEHAYEDPAAYARYMCHPYHICVLDRFLLPESPECITAPRPELGLGLLGYEVDGAPFRRDRGIRRLVAMKAASRVETGAWRVFAAGLTDLPARSHDLRVSIVAPNTMGLEWSPDGWTHLWEQAYDDEAAMRRSLTAEAGLLASGPIEGWTDLWYPLDAEPSDREP